MVAPPEDVPAPEDVEMDAEPPALDAMDAEPGEDVQTDSAEVSDSVEDVAEPDTWEPECVDPSACDDGDPCTLDLCVVLSGVCTHTTAPADTPCQDGVWCTISDVCNLGDCKGKPRDCGPAWFCGVENCLLGPDKCVLQPLNMGKPCEDDSACTLLDKCVDGVCKGVDKDCSDDLDCTFDVCQGAKATCAHLVSGWGQTHGGPHNDYATVVVPAANGGFAVFGDLGLGSTKSNMWLVWLNSAGSKVGDYQYGGSGIDQCQDVVQLAGGGYALCGHSGKGSVQGDDGYLVRTDAAGKKIWEKNFGDTKTDRLRGIVAAKDGTLTMVGGSGQKDVGGGAVWLVQTDSSGKMAWQWKYGANDNRDGAALVALADNKGFVIVGGGTPPLGGSRDLLLMGVNSKGNELWNKLHGTSQLEDGDDILLGPSGELIVVGFKTNEIKQTGEVWLMATDLTGNIKWETTYGLSGVSRVWSMTAVKAGGFALAGFTSAKGAGGQDAWLIRTTETGGHMWDRTFGGVETDVAVTVAEANDGGFVIAGYTQSSGAGANDMWISRVNSLGEQMCQ